MISKIANKFQKVQYQAPQNALQLTSNLVYLQSDGWRVDCCEEGNRDKTALRRTEPEELESEEIVLLPQVVDCQCFQFQHQTASSERQERSWVV